MHELITPQPGDVWEFKLPGKRKLTKRVGSLELKSFRQDDETVKMPYVNWERERKG